jgi:hypothetical protein
MGEGGAHTCVPQSGMKSSRQREHAIAVGDVEAICFDLEGAGSIIGSVAAPSDTAHS